MRTAEFAPVAKSKGRPKQSGRDDVTVKFDRTLVGMAQMTAKAKGVSLAEYLSEAARVIIEKDFAKEMERLKGKGAKGE